MSQLVDIDTVPEVAHLCDFRIGFSRVDLEDTPLGTRLTFVVDGGEVAGPGLSGEFLPGGGDWVLVGDDGIARLDVRATLRTHDGALVHVTNSGRAVLDADARHRMVTGELIRWNEMYARSSPLFETGDERYKWLNGLHTVAVNEFSLTAVHYRIFEVR